MMVHDSHGAGEVAESSIFRLVGSRKRVPLDLAWVSDTPSGLTYSRKVTPPKSATPCEPMGAIFIQSTTRADIIGNKG